MVTCNQLLVFVGCGEIQCAICLLAESQPASAEAGPLQEGSEQ